MAGFSAALTIFLDGLAARPEPVAVPAAANRAAGPAIWFVCADAAAVDSLGGVLSQLGLEHPDVTPLVSVASGPMPDGTGALAVTDPGERLSAFAAALDRHRPAVLVLVGSAFRPAAVAAAEARGIPVLGLALRASTRSWLQSWPARPLSRRHLARFRQLLCEDRAALRSLLRAGAPAERTRMGGLLARDIRVLPCNEAERESLAELLSARPIWCAAALPMAELPVILAAHRLAMQRSHRLLLVLVPADPADGPAVRDRIAAEGWIVGLRSEGEDPVDDMPIYVADLGGELGLWLRVAPVSWIGGTLDGAGTRSPMEAAALGSAILHGPSTGAHAVDYARLAAARAARQVKGAEDLAAAVEQLIAPDEAAAMAHAAWEVSSAGEGAATAAVQALADLLPRRAG